MNILKINSPGVGRYEYSKDTTSLIIDPVLLIGATEDVFEKEISISKNTYTPIKGDKVYFLPGVSIPRIKFKNVCTEYDIKTVRDVNEANVIFGSKKTFNEITDTYWVYEIKTTDFINFLSAVDDKIDTFYKEKLNTVLEFYTNDNVIVDYPLISWISNLTNNSFIEGNTHSKKYIVIKDLYTDVFNIIKNKEILNETVVIDVLNGEDAAVIDETMYKHISEMFSSSDDDNHVLAMEIMANSKYTESLIYLELLFHYYSHKIYASNTKNHVNFKSLLSYLNKNKNNPNTDIDAIAASLIDKDQFTSDKIDIILNNCSDRIIYKGQSRYFTLKSITLNPEYCALLNSNYNYPVKDDYIPVIDETPVEEEILPVIIEEKETESEFATEDNFEEASEKETSHMLYEVDNEDIEVLLKAEEEEVEEEELTLEIEINNNQTETNDTSDFEWF